MHVMTRTTFAVIKFVLFLVCRRVDTPGTEALAQDHRNDVLSNTIAIACGLIGGGIVFVPAGNYILSYTAQVIAPGEFAIPPLQVEEMYDPDVFGRGMPGSLRSEGSGSSLRSEGRK